MRVGEWSAGLVTTRTVTCFAVGNFNVPDEINDDLPELSASGGEKHPARQVGQKRRPSRTSPFPSDGCAHEASRPTGRTALNLTASILERPRIWLMSASRCLPLA
jgi:hypothetical protein